MKKKLQVTERVAITPRLPDQKSQNFLFMAQSAGFIEQIVHTEGFRLLSDEDKKVFGKILSKIHNNHKEIYFSIPTLDVSADVIKVQWRKRVPYNKTGIKVLSDCGQYEITLVSETHGFIERIK